MRMKFVIVFVMIFGDFVCLHVQGQKETVNSKLDFNASDEESTQTTTTSRHSSNNNGNNGNNNSGTNTNNKSSPKIQGVRVTVDTGKGKKSAAESSSSKESVEFTDNKNKKKIGIHTDITFEISDDSNIDINSTNSGQNDDHDDASVPVFRGRGSSGITTHRPRRPYDPKSSNHWPSSNHQPTLTSSNGHHHHHHTNRNHYPSSPSNTHHNRRINNDEEIYRATDNNHENHNNHNNHNNNWSGFIPITSIWTTERSYYEPYHRPNDVIDGFTNLDYATNPNWKPCYCVSAENRNRRDNHRRIGYIQIDDKLDKDLSKKPTN